MIYDKDIIKIREKINERIAQKITTEFHGRCFE